MTLWSVKNPRRPYLLETISVGYINTVLHARDYKVMYVAVTSAFLLSCVKRRSWGVSIKAS